jgi:hypothetical protein
MTLRLTESDRWLLRPALVATLGVVAVCLAIALNFLLPQGGDYRGLSGWGQPPDAGTAPIPPTQASVGERSSVPGFDVVRINPSGDAVVAGRAEPGATVILRDGEQVLGTVVADPHGEWVFLPDKPLPPGAHRLDLEIRAGNSAIRSKDEVLIVVPQAGEDIAGKPAGAGSQPLALRIVRDGGPSIVLQKPEASARSAALAIDAVDYDENGRITVSGSAPASSRLRLTIDGQQVGEATAHADGRWRVNPQRSLSSSDLHTLAIEQIGAAGKSVARAAVPLSVGASSGARIDNGEVVVERGENLWRLARSAYGRGTLYTVIFEANRGLIDNPRLIYPGQVFRLPQSIAEESAGH